MNQPRKIPGYPQHSLSEDGILYKNGHECDVFINKQGYRAAYIWRGKRCSRHPKLIYKLMAKTYLDPPDPSVPSLVRHLDGNSQNDHKDNLKWGTHAENMEDMRKHNMTRSSLTNDMKIAIKVALEQKRTPEEVAEFFNLGYPTVYRILNKKDY